MCGVGGVCVEGVSSVRGGWCVCGGGEQCAGWVVCVWRG